MKSFLHDRIELAEAYAQARRLLDGAELDALLARIMAAAVRAGALHFGSGAEVLVHLERTAKGPALRATVTGRALGRWFPRGKNLRAAATLLNQRGRLFVRDVIAAFAAEVGGIARKETRRKAPGKIADLWERITPAGMLQVSRMADLAAKERAWLSDEIASLMRTVHSPKKFADLMTRLKRETKVAFLPATAAEIANVRSKLVGIATDERHLRRRRTLPSFAAAKPPGAIASRTRIGAGGRAGEPVYYAT